MAPKSKSKSASKSKSKSDSKSSPAASGSAIFKAGALVEVSVEDDGFRGSWFSGKIIRRQGPDKFLVEYDDLLQDENSSKRLKEVLKLHQLRPIPPSDPDQEFKSGDEVDAFHNDGWWEGHINKELPDGRFTVYFRASREQIEFTKQELRLHREWLDENWNPPFQPRGEQPPQQQDDNEPKKLVAPPHVKVADTVTGEKGDFEYMEGTLVEASSDEDGYRGAWFSGTIVEAKGDNMFVVEYETLVDDDSKPLREEVDILHVRPPPPETDAVAHFSLLDEVDAFQNECWWVGVISKVLGDSRYIVYFRNSSEELEFQHSQLRPHQDLIDGKWVMVSKGLKF